MQITKYYFPINITTTAGLKLSKIIILTEHWKLS